MKKRFDELCFEISKSTTEKYSTSFSLGILALHASIRPAIYAIYGFVRLADEIVDSFHDYDKAVLLMRLKDDTSKALDEKISLNPILQSFQEIVHQYKIDGDLIEQFFHSMEMDLYKTSFDSEEYKNYILGSAEVVGLMCLKVFTQANARLYEELRPFAMKLGSAFQKVNFLRDVKEDYQLLGRTYFPNMEMNVFDSSIKLQIEQEIEAEFKEAMIGIRKLPASAKFGVYLACKYYFSLFKKIKKTPAEKIFSQRVRISNGHKLSLAMSSFVQYKIAF